MCRIRTPKPPPTPVYAAPPPANTEQPIVEPASKTESNESANLKAKRRGARGLRTDLGVTPGADISTAGGLVIPKPAGS